MLWGTSVVVNPVGSTHATSIDRKDIPEMVASFFQTFPKRLVLAKLRALFIWIEKRNNLLWQTPVQSFLGTSSARMVNENYMTTYMDILVIAPMVPHMDMRQ